jgi:hypothetical protein
MTQSVPFILPETANIPDNWKLAEDAEKVAIAFPSWSKQNGIYVSVLDKRSRELVCECKGYQFNKICHHVRGIRWASCRPIKKRKGIADTSIESINSMSPEELSNNRAKVFEVVRDSGPISIRGISEELHWPEHCVTGRLMEVREMGFVDQQGEEIDRVTGKRVKLWGVV